MANQDSLLRLDGDDTSSALSTACIHQPPVGFPSLGACRKASTHLSAVQTPLFDLGHDESLATHVDTLSVGLVNSIAGSVQDCDDVLHLIGFDLAGFFVSRGMLHSASMHGRRGAMGRRPSGTVKGYGTVKPEVVAHTLSPAALMMQALSMWPVPTRLRGNVLAGAREAGRTRSLGRPAADCAVVRTWSQRMLDTSS